MKAKEIRDMPDDELVEQIAHAAQGPLRPALRQRHRRARGHRRRWAARKRDLARALTIARERQLQAGT